MQQNLSNEAIKVLAAASKTPFWTSFKICMGIALAQLLSVALAIGGFTSLVYAIWKSNQ